MSLRTKEGGRASLHVSEESPATAAEALAELTRIFVLRTGSQASLSYGGSTQFPFLKLS